MKKSVPTSQQVTDGTSDRPSQFVDKKPTRVSGQSHYVSSQGTGTTTIGGVSKPRPAAIQPAAKKTPDETKSIPHGSALASIDEEFLDIPNFLRAEQTGSQPLETDVKVPAPVVVPPASLPEASNLPSQAEPNTQLDVSAFLRGQENNGSAQLEAPAPAIVDSHTAQPEEPGVSHIGNSHTFSAEASPSTNTAPTAPRTIDLNFLQHTELGMLRTVLKAVKKSHYAFPNLSTRLRTIEIQSSQTYKGSNEKPAPYTAEDAAYGYRLLKKAQNDVETSKTQLLYEPEKAKDTLKKLGWIWYQTTPKAMHKLYMRSDDLLEALKNAVSVMEKALLGQGLSLEQPLVTEPAASVAETPTSTEVPNKQDGLFKRMAGVCQKAFITLVQVWPRIKPIAAKENDKKSASKIGVLKIRILFKSLMASCRIAATQARLHFKPTQKQPKTAQPRDPSKTLMVLKAMKEAGRSMSRHVWTHRREIAAHAGNKLKNHAVEGGLAMTAGFLVKAAFTSAAAAVTLPVAMAAGIAACSVREGVKFHREKKAAQKNGTKLPEWTTKKTAKVVFIGAAGGLVGHEIANLFAGSLEHGLHRAGNFISKQFHQVANGVSGYFHHATATGVSSTPAPIASPAPAIPQPTPTPVVTPPMVPPVSDAITDVHGILANPHAHDLSAKTRHLLAYAMHHPHNHQRWALACHEAAREYALKADTQHLSSEVLHYMFGVEQANPKVDFGRNGAIALEDLARMTRYGWDHVVKNTGTAQKIAQLAVKIANQSHDAAFTAGDRGNLINYFAKHQFKIPGLSHS